MLTDNTNVRHVLNAIQEAGGRSLIVGGAVRDYMLGKLPTKDMDIEVYGIPVETVIDRLSQLARVEKVGASCGVIKVRIEDEEFDISIPRRENKVGKGHKGFLVDVDPTLTPREAAERRDFTWNAMAYDPLTGDILDFFGGRKDIADGIIRHASPAFAEDPLRVLRAVQFASRFDFKLASETAALCQHLAIEYGELAVERVWGEWEKWALKGCTPSAGLSVLRDSGWAALYPELTALIDCPQDISYHPEGDVWVHGLLVTDAAAGIAERDGIGGDDRLVLIFSALCHDLGKPATTVVHPDGRITSHGHREAGVNPTRSFLKGIGFPERLVDRVVILVEEHMVHASLASQANFRNVRRLAPRLGRSGENIATLARLIEADHNGRPPLPGGLPASMVEIMALAGNLNVSDAQLQPVLLGRHLVAAGYEPGPAMGKLLKATLEAQLDGEFADIESGLAWLKTHTERILSGEKTQLQGAT